MADDAEKCSNEIKAALHRIWADYPDAFCEGLRKALQDENFGVEIVASGEDDADDPDDDEKDDDDK